jgi:hypothetical protein
MGKENEKQDLMLDLKALSFVQLHRLAADVGEELKARSENDSEGDTVRVPVPVATD